LAFGLTALGFAGACVCALMAGDAYYHLDDVTHFLYAKWAWQWPRYLIDGWGRPGFTVAYWLPAAAGWTACRVWSCLLTAGGAWFAYLSADRLGLRPAWPVIPLCFLQPLYFVSAQTTLTETPLAFYVSLAIYLAIARRWSLSAVVLSVAFVTRHEAMAFLPVWLWFAVKDRASWRAVALVFWAPLIVQVGQASAGMDGLLNRLLDPTPTAQYGHGGWFTFLAKSLHAWGPGVTVPAVLGCGALWKFGHARILLAAIVIYFVAQTVVFRFGLFASGGYSRFLVGISPLVAVAAWAGVRALLRPESAGRAAACAAVIMALLWWSTKPETFWWKGTFVDPAEIYRAMRALRIAAIAFVALGAASFLLLQFGSNSIRTAARYVTPAALLVLLALTAFVFLRPLRTPADAKLIRDAVNAIETAGLSDRTVVSAHPYAMYLTGTRMSPNRPSIRERIRQAPIGTLILWEPRLAASEDHGIRLDELAGNPLFTEVFRSDPLPNGGTGSVWVFEKRGAPESANGVDERGAAAGHRPTRSAGTTGRRERAIGPAARSRWPHCVDHHGNLAYAATQEGMVPRRRVAEAPSPAARLWIEGLR